MKSSDAGRAKGFTLVELLVVITIIGILISLLLPAVLSAREQANITKCQNHLKQLGLGMIDHESARGYLPTNGWGYRWTGDPDCGTGLRQPGNWAYCILPYIDQVNLSRVGAGLAWSDSGNSSPKANALQIVATTPIETLYCPSRRGCSVYPTSGSSASEVNCVNTSVTQRSDYAGNGGDNGLFDANETGQPSSYSQGFSASYWAGFPVGSGTVLQHAELHMSRITDGLSNTYLLGEKYLNPNNYSNGNDPGDNESAMTGFNWDTSRAGASGYNSSTKTYTYQQPQQDSIGNNDYFSFGSAHPSGFSMVFCDGAVRMLKFSMDPETHRRMCNRADGLAVDPSKL